MESAKSIIKPGNLKPFFPFAELPPEYVIVASNFAMLVTKADGEIVLESNSEDSSDYFLLKGNLLIEDIYGAISVLSSNTTEANQPLPQLRPSAYRICAKGAATLIKIPQEVIRRVRAEAPERDLALEEDATLDITQSREFFADFKEELRMNRVRLPSLGPSAARVHKLLSGSKISETDLIAAISMDPAISVKLLKIANSAIFNSEGKVQDLDSLVARLGVFSTREIAACFAFRDVYKNSSPELVSRLVIQVTQSQQVSALASAIAELGEVIDPKVASLAGLLSNVGVLPIFSYSMHNVAYAMNPELVDRAIRKMSRDVGVLLAKKWRFSDDLVACIDNADDWSYDCGDTADLASTVLCAKYHYLLSCSGFKSLPKPKDVPSISTAMGGSLSEKASLRIIGRAKELMNGKAVA